MSARQSSRWRRVEVLAFALLLCSVLAVHQLRRAREVPVFLDAAVETWRAATPEGTPLRADAGAEGTPRLRLPQGAHLRLVDEDIPIHRYAFARFLVAPGADASESAGAAGAADAPDSPAAPAAPDARAAGTAGEPPCADLLVRWTRGRGYRARLFLGAEPHGELTLESGDGRVVELARSGPKPIPTPPDGLRRLTVQLREDGFAVEVDGHVVLAAQDSTCPDGFLELHAVSGALDVRQLSASGRKSRQSAGFTDFLVQDAMMPPAPPAPPATDPATSVLVVASTWLAALLLIGAMSASCPRPGAWLGASVLLLAPAAAALTVAVLARLPSAPVLAGVVSPIGLPLVLARLDAAADERPRPASARRLVSRLAGAAWLVGAAALAGATGWVAVGSQRALDAELQARVDEARALPAPAAVESAGTFTLGPDDARTLRGPWTELHLQATVRLEAGAQLGVRVRAPRAEVAEGLLVTLSADPRVPCSIQREDPMTLQPLALTDKVLAHAQPLAVRLESVGRMTRLAVDGRLLAEVDTREHVSGAIVLLTLRGAASVSGLRVEPRDAPAADPSAAASSGALAPLGAALAVALAAALLLGQSWTMAFRRAACGLLPLLLLLLLVDDVDGRPTMRHLGFAAAGCAALLATVALFSFRTRPARAALVAVAVALAVPPTVRSSVHGRFAVTTDTLNRLNYQDWRGERLEPDLLHVQHPLLRRWNGYLAQHRFRERAVPRVKPPRSLRVVTLGGSSTFGWRIPPGTQGDWPALLETALRAGPPEPSGRQFEVVNAAWVGATSWRVYPELRDVLCDFEPDVVVLSVFFNDCTALSQGDEPAYLERVSAPGYRRGPLDDWFERRRREAERRALLSISRRGLSVADAAERWRASGATGWPPDRFADSLRRFARLASERGFRMVFVKEAIAGDAPFLWKEEFYAAMDRVGAEHGIPVVDPTPALQAAGGRDLFLDDVHLKPSGHRVMAGLLEPVVRREAFAARRVVGEGTGGGAALRADGR